MNLRFFPLLVGLLLTTAAHAAPRDEARAAYDRGLEARKRGDMKRASEELAKADALVPNASALQAALDAAVEADDAALGEELVARSQREPASPALAASVTAAHLKFNGRAGRLRALCPRTPKCFARLDGRAIDTDVPVWTTTGAHLVTFVVGGTSQNKPVDVTTEGMPDVFPATKGQQVHPEDRPPPGRTHGEGGLPPLVTYAGVGLSVALLAATTFFALDAKHTHDAFHDASCAAPGGRGNPGCQDAHDDGVRRQAFANVALVSTFVVAAATAVVALAFTDWKPRAGVTF